jgi:GDP/UDP-N,N'-diacetylbacillosamine 2-epimerase (hydrolysing)
MHLSNEFGLTYMEIEKDMVPIDQKIEILLGSDTSVAMSKAIGLAVISFSEYFERIKPDMTVLLGDRFEIFAVATAAAIQHIPIAHIHGGETTEGAIDEFFRHSITKMSYLHFTSTETYRNRVIAMGESPDRVYNVGAIGIENIISSKLLSKDELAKEIQLDIDQPYALITFHPVTMEENSAEGQMQQLLCALEKIQGINWVITKANADANGRLLNRMIDEFCQNHANAIAYTSLGSLRYLSSMKYCEMVIGNSSSGILEAPAFKKPTINIGDRQKGRIMPTSVICCQPNFHEIIEAIKYSTSKEFKDKLLYFENPYGNGNTSYKIIEILKVMLFNKVIDLKKTFYDLNVYNKDVEY